jgi:hypothetical protein
MFAHRYTSDIRTIHVVARRGGGERRGEGYQVMMDQVERLHGVAVLYDAARIDLRGSLADDFDIYAPLGKDTNQTSWVRCPVTPDF